MVESAMTYPNHTGWVYVDLKSEGEMTKGAKDPIDMLTDKLVGYMIARVEAISSKTPLMYCMPARLLTFPKTCGSGKLKYIPGPHPHNLIVTVIWTPPPGEYTHALWDRSETLKNEKFDHNVEEITSGQWCGLSIFCNIWRNTYYMHYKSMIQLHADKAVGYPHLVYRHYKLPPPLKMTLEALAGLDSEFASYFVVDAAEFSYDALIAPRTEADERPRPAPRRTIRVDDEPRVLEAPRPPVPEPSIVRRPRSRSIDDEFGGEPPTIYVGSHKKKRREKPLRAIPRPVVYGRDKSSTKPWSDVTVVKRVRRDYDTSSSDDEDRSDEREHTLTKREQPKYSADPDVSPDQLEILSGELGAFFGQKPHD